MLKMNCKLVSACLFFAIVAASGLPAQEEARSNSIQTESDLLDSIYTDCLRKDSLSCLKYKIYSFVDKTLGQKDTITVTDGIQIVKSGNEKDGAPRAFNGDETIESLVLDRVSRFLNSHTIKVDLKGSDLVNAVQSGARSLSEVVEDDAVEEGRGKKKKKGGNMGGLMAILALKAALLGKLALWAIALIAGKALIIGKIALVLSAIIGIKKLLGSQGHGKHVTYEVVAHPQHSSSHVATHEVAYSGGSGHGGGYGGDIGGGSYGSSGHGGWGRSLDAQQLAYRGQLPAQQQQQ
ncbi:uncharacterized protein LOC115891690 [Sitophilus oryzae]|uniref:Uncharacterized protein LOC115891690 n=1 Tax=Sitophilus oryzae TaxID=7048 RepID=A0A6J2YXW8_SITOR|nr:uncharacterized protein LOC115891690 [Sitophilus oryzae]